jgi:signal transduction histidine kinase
LEIGKDLHDNVCQLLSTARMLIGLTERNLSNPPDTLITANHTIAQAIQEIRDLSRTLDKEWLEQFSFTENLKNVVQKINSSKQIVATCEMESNMDYEASEQIILFRIVQEAIQNSLRHGEPSKIQIKGVKDNGHYSILVEDDGKGIESVEISTGLGIRNMKRRTMLLGGNISWNSHKSTGTTVRIMLPLKQSFNENLSRIGG